MTYEGNLLKMKVEKSDVVHYSLPLGTQNIPLNKVIGHLMEVTYNGVIHCIKCQKKINKTFGQGFCYPCYQTAPEAEECVLRPELCRAHEGVARDLEYAASHCLIPHYVYVSYTGGFKVGVTRHTQIPVRWIDQGAILAAKLAKTNNRYEAGLIEVELKKIISDKTNWRAMLKSTDVETGELDTYLASLKEKIPGKFKHYIVPFSDKTVISYPVTSYPDNIRSIHLDKMPHIKAKLMGIKGQYLMFEDGKVFNVRNHSGYFVQLKI